MAMLMKLIHAFFSLYRPKDNTLNIAPLLAMGLATAGSKAIGGLIQRSQANKVKPSGYIPPELKKAKAEADMAVNAGEYAGQSRDEANVRQSASQAITNASKVAGGANEMLNFAGVAQGMENRGMRDIAQRALAWRDNWRRTRTGVRSQIAGIQRQNQQQAQAAKSALIGASNQNIWAGLTEGAAAGAAALASRTTPGTPGWRSKYAGTNASLTADGLLS